MILIRALCASAASSRNLSSRSVASSTVMPITLISSDTAASSRREVTVTLCSFAGDEIDFDVGAAPSTAVISSSATFIRSGPASISADDPSKRRNTTGLLNPRTRIFVPGCSRSALTASSEAAFAPRSACDSEMVCTTAAFNSSRASPRTSCIFRRAVFSICARSSRSFTASTTRATFSSKRFCISANCASSSFMRFCCRSTHSVRSFLRSSSSACRSSTICFCMRSKSSRLRCK